MKVIFSSTNQIAAITIKFFTMSRWHHVGIVVGEYVYEARMFNGVIKTPIEAFKARGDWTEVDFPVSNENGLIQFLDDQLGKPYDFFGALGLPFRSPWQNDNKWYCSELAAAAFEEIEEPIVRQGLRGVSPRDLWVQKNPV